MSQASSRFSRVRGPHPFRAVVAAMLLVLAGGLPAAASEPLDDGPDGEGAVAAETPSRGLRYPDTAPGRIAEAFFAAYNTGDDEAFAAFNDAHRSAASLARQPEQRRRAMFHQIRTMVGDLEPVGVLASDESSVSVHARSDKASGWLSVTFTVESDPPHKLSRLALEPAGDPARMNVSYAGVTDLQALADRLRTDLQAPALGIAVADESSVLGAAVSGVRAVGDDAPATVGDRFHIGSITKSITATVVGALVEEGVLDWEMTIGAALPDVPMLEVYRDVTLLDLLRHRGGMPPHLTFDDGEMSRLVELPGTPIEQRAAFVAEVLQEEPVDVRGSFHYSNAGYGVAGHIAERHAGASWESLVRRHVLDPGGLEQSGIGWPATPARPDQPRGHFGGAGALRPQGLEEYPLGSFLAPAGDVHCSVSDLARYGQLHLKGLLGADGALDSATVRRLHEPVASGNGMPYACGWMVRAEPDGAVHQHNGSAGTFYAVLTVLPESRRVVAVVLNRAALEADPLIERAIDAILAMDDPTSAPAAR